jgi:hypothetical protein
MPKPKNPPVFPIMSMARSTDSAHMSWPALARMLALTNRPIGTHRSRASSYWTTRSPNFSGPANEKVSAPRPFSPAMVIVSCRVHATQSGGCGFWRGFGTTLRGGIETNSPEKPPNGSSAMQPIATFMPSIHISRFLPGSTQNPSSSLADEPSPVPSSTRPFDTRSRTATRSATRAGWLMLGSNWTMPCPSRMFFVRWLSAARNTSGAVEWQYSSRKWCSVNPDGVEPQLVGEFELFEQLLQPVVLGSLGPRARQDVFAEHGHLHVSNLL